MEDTQKQQKTDAEPQIKIPEKKNPEESKSLTPENPIEKYSSYLPVASKSIEERLPLAGMLIAVIGYIVIAAFGRINNVWDYLAYLSILIIGLSFYELKIARIPKITYLLLGIIVILLGFIMAQNGIYNFFANFIHSNSTSSM